MYRAIRERIIGGLHETLERASGYSESTIMPLEIQRRETEGITIFDLRGRIVAGSESAELRDALTQFASGPHPNLILNMQHVHFVDSTGLGILVLGHSSVEQVGGALKLLNISKRSAQLLILTKLSTVFEMFNDEQTAINSFFPDREVKRFDILDFVNSQEGGEESAAGENRETGKHS
jgi:anti-sigma B factor antagonist